MRSRSTPPRRNNRTRATFRPPGKLARRLCRRECLQNLPVKKAWPMKRKSVAARCLASWCASRQVGQQIKANDVLVVLEAMKMETVVTSPGDGKIAKVNVKSGDPVQSGQVLIEFE